MIPYLPIVHLNFGPVVVQTWGFFVALGFLSALSISLWQAQKEHIREEDIWDLMIIALLGMIAGGRIFYVLLSPYKDASAILDLHGGFSLIGGIILAGVSCLLYMKHKKQDVAKTLDVLTPGIIIALIFTRLGCFLVNDHIGKITGLPWGVEFTDGTVRHPVALYHIIFLLVILSIILKIKVEEDREGALFMSLCTFYAVFGLIADFSRCDDLSLCDLRYMYLTITQWILLIFLAFSLIVPLLLKIIKNKEG